MKFNSLYQMKLFCQHSLRCAGRRAGGREGFTLLELLSVCVIIALLAGLLLPALANAKIKAKAMSCLNNERQLAVACQLYADESNDRFPYNLGAAEIRNTVGANTFLNWSSTIMDWETQNPDNSNTSDNTNTVLLTKGGIGPYTSRSAGIYRCPGDKVLSDLQINAGWEKRVRSFSMNAMVGDVGIFGNGVVNTNNPEYKQFYKVSQVSKPSQIFVFIEEHPDSINDGYFLNRPDTFAWFDLPASYHNGAANLSFTDGHAERHRWLSASTKLPSRPHGAQPLPSGTLSADDRVDYRWLMDRTTVDSYSRSTAPAPTYGGYLNN